MLKPGPNSLRDLYLFGIAFVLPVALGCFVHVRAEAQPELASPIESPMSVRARVVVPRLTGRFNVAQFTLASPLGEIRDTCVIDADGDGTDEVVALEQSASGVQQLRILTPTPSFKTAVRSLDSIPSKIALRFLVCGNFRELGRAELIMGDGSSWFRAETELKDWRKGNVEESISTVSLPDLGSALSKVFVANTLGDGRDELILETSGEVVLVESNTSGMFRRLPTDELPLSYSVAGVGDFDGDSFAELLLCHQTIPSCLVQSLQGVSPLGGQTWAVFPEFSKRLEQAIGDFNADGKADFYARGSWPAGVTIVFSNGSVGIEQVVSMFWNGPLEFQREQQPGVQVVAGNFSQSGADDLLRLESGSSVVQLARSEFVSPVANALVASAVSDARSDTQGFVEVALSEPPIALTVQADGFRGPGVSSKRLVNPRGRRVVGIDVYPLPDSEQSIVGQPVGLGPSAPGPFICLAYNPGSLGKWGDPLLRCPKNYGIYGVGEMSGRVRTASFARGSVRCCRLPYDDILTNEEVVVERECPTDFISVGMETTSDFTGKIHHMRCAKINTARFRLGDVTEGEYHGSGLNMRRYWGAAYIEKFPLAIRTGLTRRKQSSFDLDGCHGYPYGSLFVQKGKRCYHQGYRRLLYRGIEGDPEEGTPVTMFPNCSALESEFNPASGCLKTVE